MKKIFLLLSVLMGIFLWVYAIPFSKEEVSSKIENSYNSVSISKPNIPFSKTKSMPSIPITQTTFPVCKVEIPDTLLPQKSYKQVMQARMISDHRIAKEDRGNEVESNKRFLNPRPKINKNRALWAFPPRRDSLIMVRGNPFAAAVELAYAKHYPLVISPDMIWLLICQGFAMHVDLNGEQLRSHFVQHEGKKNLHVKRTQLHKENISYWEDVIAEFSGSIQNHVGAELHDLTTNQFSTTTPIEATAFEVTLMDAMSSYFTYSMNITCGIPSITLEGTPEDWKRIEQDFEQFAKYDLKWWVDDLKPVLHQFTKAAKGKVDTDFWQSIYDIEYKHAGCSADRAITGWVIKFYPYLENKSKNPMIGRNPKDDWGRDYEQERLAEEVRKLRGESPKKEPIIRMAYRGPDLEVSDLPLGISKADVIIYGDAGEFKIDFLAGFVGISQDEETKALRPEINWGVVDSGRKPTKEEMVQARKN